MLAVRRFGKRIFVEGDLQVFAEDADALAAVERLQVNGNVCVADCVADAFFEKCAIYGKVTVYKGEWMDISHTTSTIDKELLEDMDDGVTLNISHSTVEISTDVTAELASEKIHEIILNSSTLILGLDQQKALRRKIRNHDADVVIREYENTVEAEPEPKEQEFTETKVNSAYYKL